MALLRQETDGRLRFGPGVSAPGSRTGAGVVLFNDVPVGALVLADVDRPTEIPGSTDGSSAGEQSDGISQPYIFETASLPGPLTIGGVVATRLNHSVLVQSGNGVMTRVQVEPTWVALSPTQTGSLMQKGRKTHSVQMAGASGATPAASTAASSSPR